MHASDDSTTRRVSSRVARGLELWRLFRAERESPGPFYRRLAADLVADLDARHGVRGAVVADLGGGPGYYTDALRDAGATALPIDRELDELILGGAPPGGAVIADAGRLPLPDARLDGVLCSNMLEHTPQPGRVVDEIVRVLRPGGWAYISFTNWYSPWGGHEMSPYHLAGPHLGPRLYERRHGPDHKHHVGENLFPLHIGPTLRQVRARTDLEVTGVEPRYWPWARVITRVPGVRELLSWNCVIRIKRVVVPDVPSAGGTEPRAHAST